jgi:2-haloacid dehalogenase
MLTLEPPPRVITFDCYGTLVQWQQAMREAALSVLSAHLTTSSRMELAASLATEIRARATIQQQRQPYQSYAAVLRASLDEALADKGHTATEDDHRTLWSSLSRIAPHSDTLAALTKLRTRYRLAIISNTDDELIAGTVESLAVPFDYVVTAQQAGAYKPDHRLFEYAHTVMKVTKEETIHVAMGQFADLKVCKELGIRSVWINRDDEPLDPQWSPDAVLRDLSDLPGLLLAR